jgi:hypothetical protein
MRYQIPTLGNQAKTRGCRFGATLVRWSARAVGSEPGSIAETNQLLKAIA